MNICLFTQDEITKPLPLTDERAKHILGVLHKKEGDSFEAGIINSSAGRGTITGIRQETQTNASGKTFTGGSLTFSYEPLSDGKPLYPLVMIIGFPRPIQLKRLLRDMASLGVKEVHLTGTELGEKSYLKSDLATSDAGYKMLLDGSAQAASCHVPLLVKHDSLKECLLHLQKKFPDAEHKLALDNVGSDFSLTKYLDQNFNGDTKALSIAAIGSERGWTQNERGILQDAGFSRLSMGPRILRTETAATTAASLILGAQGFLQ